MGHPESESRLASIVKGVKREAADTMQDGSVGDGGQPASGQSNVAAMTYEERFQNLASKIALPVESLDRFLPFPSTMSLATSLKNAASQHVLDDTIAEIEFQKGLMGQLLKSLKTAGKDRPV